MSSLPGYGVQEALLRALWSGLGKVLRHDLAGHLASLRDPRPGPRTARGTDNDSGIGGQASATTRSLFSA